MTFDLEKHFTDIDYRDCNYCGDVIINEDRILKEHLANCDDVPEKVKEELLSLVMLTEIAIITFLVKKFKNRQKKKRIVAFEINCNTMEKSFLYV